MEWNKRGYERKKLLLCGKEFLGVLKKVLKLWNTLRIALQMRSIAE